MNEEEKQSTQTTTKMISAHEDAFMKISEVNGTYETNNNDNDDDDEGSWESMDSSDDDDNIQSNVKLDPTALIESFFITIDK